MQKERREAGDHGPPGRKITPHKQVKKEKEGGTN